MDGITRLHDDDDDDDPEELMVNLHKDRRSGVDRRHGPSSNSLARLDIEREYRAEIRQLREEETSKDVQIAELKAELATVREWQRDKEETLQAAKIIVHAGTALKITIMILIGFTAAIGGIAASLEAFKQWFK
jgi:Pyruvate/2-oxoacid:ferredoxin oxidoreductase gamma subunit